MCTMWRASRNLWRSPLTHPVADKLPPPHSLHRYNTPVTTLKCLNAARCGYFGVRPHTERGREAEKEFFSSAVEKPHYAIIKRLNLLQFARSPAGLCANINMELRAAKSAKWKLEQLSLASFSMSSSTNSCSLPSFPSDLFTFLHKFLFFCGNLLSH